MIVSYLWLKELINFPYSPEELAAKLTMAGLEVEAILKLEGHENDWIIDFSITPNRGDCLSHLGVAREIAAIMGRPLQLEPPTDVSAVISETPFQVRIDAPDLCPRYLGRVIRNVTIGPSPDWLVNRLEAAGLRSINNVVDATNYVLMERGHPLHAFDAQTLEGEQIIVRRAVDGEKMIAIDGREIELTRRMMVIADAEQPVALAGVMGGKDTEVTEMTRHVFLESAFFNPINIRKTAKTLSMTTESSYRFERGVDFENVRHALNRVTEIIQDLAGGEVEGEIIDCTPTYYEMPEVSLRDQKAHQVVGVKLNRDEIESILRNLGFEITASTDAAVTVKVPPHRRDIEMEIDLAEEVARMWGYNKIPSTPLSEWYELVPKKPLEVLSEKLRKLLMANGFSEAINFSFIEDKSSLKFAPLWGNEGQVVMVQNPLSIKQNCMRTSLIPGLLESMANNINRDIEDIKLFEIGRTFSPVKAQELPHEETMLTGLCFGKWSQTHWDRQNTSRQVDFYDIKGIIETILNIAAISDVEWKKEKLPGFDRKLGVGVYLGDKLIAVLGLMDAKYVADWGAETQVWMFEIRLEALTGAKAMPIVISELPKYPAIKWDLSFVVPNNVRYKQIEELMQNLDNTYLEAYILTDKYVGRQIPDEHYGVTFHICFRHPDRTMTDDEVTPWIEEIIKLFGQKLGAKLRTM